MCVLGLVFVCHGMTVKESVDIHVCREFTMWSLGVSRSRQNDAAATDPQGAARIEGGFREVSVFVCIYCVYI